MGVLKPTTEAPPNSVLRLIREDKEASLPPPELQTENAPIADWDRGTIPFSRRSVHSFVLNAVKAIGRYGRPVDAHGLWYWHRDGMIRAGVKLLSRYETIVTNRLHAMLLGLMLGRKVHAWDNSYGKLSTYHDAWLRGTPGLTLHQAANHEKQQLQAAGNMY